MIDGALIATLREDYTKDGAHFPRARWWRSVMAALPQLIFAPGPRQSIEGVGAGRDRIYAAITDNVIGAVHVFSRKGADWTDKRLALPGQGAADIVSANDFGPRGDVQLRELPDAAHALFR